MRESYGRLLAYLASRTPDIAAAEDALADAFEAAFRIWPRARRTRRPETWLFTAARRPLIGGGRRRHVAEGNQPELAMRASGAPGAGARLGRAGPAARTALRLRPSRDRSLGARAPDAPDGDGSRRSPHRVRVSHRAEDARAAARESQAAYQGGRHALRLPDGATSPTGRLRCGRDLRRLWHRLGGHRRPTGPRWAWRPGVELPRAAVELFPEDAEAHGLAPMLWHTDARRPRAPGPLTGARTPLPAGPDGPGRPRPSTGATGTSAWPSSHTPRPVAGAGGDPGRAQPERPRPVPPYWPDDRHALRHAAADAADPWAPRSLGPPPSSRHPGPRPRSRRLTESTPSLPERYQPWWAVRLEALIRAGARRASDHRRGLRAGGASSVERPGGAGAPAPTDQRRLTDPGEGRLGELAPLSHRRGPTGCGSTRPGRTRPTG